MLLLTSMLAHADQLHLRCKVQSTLTQTSASGQNALVRGTELEYIQPIGTTELQLVTVKPRWYSLRSDSLNGVSPAFTPPTVTLFEQAGPALLLKMDLTASFATPTGEEAETASMVRQLGAKAHAEIAREIPANTKTDSILEMSCKRY